MVIGARVVRGEERGRARLIAGQSFFSLLADGAEHGHAPADLAARVAPAEPGALRRRAAALMAARAALQLGPHAGRVERGLAHGGGRFHQCVAEAVVIAGVADAVVVVIELVGVGSERTVVDAVGDGVTVAVGIAVAITVAVAIAITVAITVAVTTEARGRVLKGERFEEGARGRLTLGVVVVVGGRAGEMAEERVVLDGIERALPV